MRGRMHSLELAACENAERTARQADICDDERGKLRENDESNQSIEWRNARSQAALLADATANRKTSNLPAVSTRLNSSKTKVDTGNRRFSSSGPQ
jgi:hypothetical protein